MVIYDQRLACSQVWFPTVQDVLQADWQDVWHSPHPPVLTVSLRFFVVIVLMRSIVSSILKCDKNVPHLFVCAQNHADKSVPVNELIIASGITTVKRNHSCDSFSTSTMAFFCIGIRQFLLLPNSTIMTSSEGMSITTP